MTAVRGASAHRDERLRDADGSSAFGAIDQRVVKYDNPA